MVGDLIDADCNTTRLDIGNHSLVVIESHVPNRINQILCRPPSTDRGDVDCLNRTSREQMNIQRYQFLQGEPGRYTSYGVVRTCC